MRPQSIIRFEQIFLASLAIGLVNTILSWETTMATINADPNAAALGPGFVYITTAIGFGINILFWYLIARKAMNVVKWILTIFMVIGLVSLPFTVTTLPPLSMAVALVLTAMQIYAIYLLFRPDAKQWFENKGDTTDLGKTFE